MTAAEVPDPRLREFLLKQGLARRGEDVRWTALSGGVSSDIWRADLGERSICVKRALPTLKVSQRWDAPIERNAYEWRWITFANHHCPGSAPQPIATDPVLGVFAMSYLPPDRYPVWKPLLLAGIADASVAANAGAIVARLHAASAGNAEIARRFQSDAIFHAIRLEPYLLATSARHPDIESRLRGLAERTARTRVALVHGDVSPKNILVGPEGPVLIDAECAWYGDPAFDAAFCLNHFLLKCVARPSAADAYLACYAAFSAAFLAGVTWEARSAVESRIASLLPALFLARIDGKSPVEYIRDERDRSVVRDTARSLITSVPAGVEHVSERWRMALRGWGSR